MTVATVVLKAIEAALWADGGAKFRAMQAITIPKCKDAYDPVVETGHRKHLGASIIGRPCSRALWYSFHWAHFERAEPRMQRLWNRGHLEEGRMVALLMAIDVEVYQYDEHGKQFRVSGVDGHFGGSLDCVLLRLPGMPPEEPVLGEFKTYNEKQFAELVKAGSVKDAKPEHWVQMQIYMSKRGLRWALYMAVNKNTDDLYAEMVECVPQAAVAYEERAAMIINSERPPPKINESPSWYQCRFCDMRPVCHESRPPAVNCRTCVHARIADAGGWGCAHWQQLIPEQVQRTGCASYQRNPHL